MLFLWTAQSWADSPADRAIRALLPPQQKFLVRAAVGDDLDFVAVLAADRLWGNWWTTPAKLGLFLQERSQPAKVHRLGILNGHPDGECFATAVYVGPSEFILSCKPEKGNQVIHERWLFDRHARSLRGSSRTERLGLTRLAAQDDHILVRTSAGQSYSFLAAQPSTLFLASEKWREPERRFGPKQSFTLERSSRTNTADFEGLWSITERPGGKARFYPFPPPDAATFAQRGLKGASVLEWAIGPWQIYEGELHFAATFYDSEGHSAYGAIGRFDTNERKYAITAPAALAPFSASAILVEGDVVWIGAFHRGEWGHYPGGLLRINRATNHADKFDVPDVIHAILRVGPRIFLATDAGLAVLEGNVVRRYLVHPDGPSLLQYLPHVPN
jgi:hypothetical protein